MLYGVIDGGKKDKDLGRGGGGWETERERLHWEALTKVEIRYLATKFSMAFRVWLIVAWRSCSCHPSFKTLCYSVSKKRKKLFLEDACQICCGLWFGCNVWLAMTCIIAKAQRIWLSNVGSIGIWKMDVLDSCQQGLSVHQRNFFIIATGIFYEEREFAMRRAKIGISGLQALILLRNLFKLPSTKEFIQTFIFSGLTKS